MTGNGAGTSASTGATCCHIICRRFDGHFMKKIGVLFGQENSFPWAFIDRVNQKTGGKDIVAEAVRIDKVIQGEPCGYVVIIELIPQFGLPTRLGGDLQLRRLAGIFQTIRGWRLEKCLPPSQSGGILSRIQRNWTARHDAAGRSEIRHVLSLLFNRSAQRADHALRSAASLSFAISNRVANPKGSIAECRARCPAVESIPRL